MRITNRDVADAIKVFSGCAIKGALCIDTHADSAERIPALYEFDHLEQSTKYRTRNGNLVHPADMIKGDRYSLATVLLEIAKCRVACVVCHRIYTHTEQRPR
jgi:hypothetical protein